MNATVPRSHRPLALAIGLALAAGSTHAATIVVDSTADPGDSGTCTLRQAIASVTAGLISGSGCVNTGAVFGSQDTIEFDSGLAKHTITISGSALAINKSMTIIGTGQTIQVSGNMRAMQVLSGASLDLSNVTISGGNTSANGAGLDVSLANATLTYVSISGNSGAYGAGIYAYNSTLTLTACTLNGNTATGFGGGLLATHGSVVTLYGTSVYGNSANIGAGVAASQNAHLTLEQPSVTGNRATSAAGGVAALYSSTVTINGGLVSNNNGGSLAGGVYAGFGSTLTVNRVLLADNTAAYGGGGEVKEGNTLAFNGTTISRNSATVLGAGLQGFGGTLSVTDSTIVGNSADTTNTASGGGIEMALGGVVNVVNSTVTGNTASLGGGFDVTGYSTLTLINSTVTGNDAAGGGIDLTSTFPLKFSSAHLYNTILSGNTATGHPASYNDALKDGTSSISAYYCLLGTGPALASYPNNNPDHYNHFTNSPLLNSLADNGGPTQTMAPMDTSEAIDNGSVNLAKTVVGDPLNFDQRGTGFPRTLSGKVDIGAYQHQPPQRIFVDGFDPEP